VFDVGPFELLALAALALFVFGPDKLPKMAADVGRMLRQLRKMAQGAKDEVTGALGPEFSDLKLDDLSLSDLDPRTFIKRQLLEESDDLDRVLKEEPTRSNGSPARTDGDGTAAGADRPVPKAPPAPPVYDGDAT
jgi:sec-independent protein translocase protein TatB